MHVLIYIYTYIYILYHISHPLLLNYPLLQLQMNLPSFGMNSVQAMSSAVPDDEHQRRATRSAPRHATAAGVSVTPKRGDGKFREKFWSFNGEIICQFEIFHCQIGMVITCYYQFWGHCMTWTDFAFTGSDLVSSAEMNWQTKWRIWRFMCWLACACSQNVWKQCCF